MLRSPEGYAFNSRRGHFDPTPVLYDLFLLYFKVLSAHSVPDYQCTYYLVVGLLKHITGLSALRRCRSLVIMWYTSCSLEQLGAVADNSGYWRIALSNDTINKY